MTAGRNSAGSSLVQAVDSCLSDRFASAFVLVVGGDVADGFVQPDRVVVLQDFDQFQP